MDRGIRYDTLVALQKLFEKYFGFTNHPSELRLGVARMKNLIIVEENCQLLKKHIQLTPRYHVAVSATQATRHLVHKINFYKDFGVTKLNASDLWMLPFFCKKPIKSIPNYISEELTTDLTENLLNTINVKKSDLKFNVDPANLTMGDLYRICLQYHLMQKYDLPPTACGTIYRMEPFVSFSVLDRAYKVFKNYDILNITKNPEVLTAIPENVETILGFVDSLKIGDMTGVEYIRHAPHIFFVPAQCILQGIHILSEYDISLNGLKRDMRILYLGAEEMCRRFDILKQDKNLWLFRKHPGFASLALYNPYVTLERFSLARKLVKAPNIGFNDITRDFKKTSIFQRNMRSPLMTGSFNGKMIRRGRLLKYVLQTELDSYAREATKIIENHRHCHSVNYEQMCETAKMLKERFSVEDVARNAQLLLFHRNVIADALTHFYTEYDGQGSTYTDSQALAICQYLLERVTNFSGDAIFIDEYPPAETNKINSEATNAC